MINLRRTSETDHLVVRFGSSSGVDQAAVGSLSLVVACCCSWWLIHVSRLWRSSRVKFQRKR